MGRAELLLVLAALSIFGWFSLTVNRSLLENSSRVLESEFEITAISLLQEVISDAGLKAFDENSVSTIPASVPGGFTSVANLGEDGGEDYPIYNDVDDFHGLTIVDTTGTNKLGWTYAIACTVGYVTSSDLENFSASPTTLKRMNLILTSDYLPNDIRLSYVYSFVRE